MSNAEDTMETSGRSTIAQPEHSSSLLGSSASGFNERGNESLEERRRRAMVYLSRWEHLPLDFEARVVTEAYFGKHAEIADLFTKLFDDFMAGDAPEDGAGNDLSIPRLWPLADACSFDFSKSDGNSPTMTPEYVVSSVSPLGEALGQPGSFSVGEDVPDPNSGSIEIWAATDSIVSHDMPCKSVTSIQSSSGFLEDETFDAICDWFRRWLDRCFQSQAPETSTSSATNQSNLSSSLKGKMRETRNFGKRGVDEDELDERDYDEGRRGGGHANPKKRSREQAYWRKFACPFPKHNASLHPRCRLVSFPTTHRMKEHIKRVHTQPDFRCYICWCIFTDESTLADHNRARTCQLRDPPLIQIDGVCRQKKEEIQKREKNSTTEVERWMRIYLILYPECASNLPSPYVDLPPDSETSPADTWLQQQDWNGTRSSEMESFFMKECPHHIEMELERIGGSPRSYTDLMQIIPRVALGLSRDYHRQKHGLAASESVERPLAEASTEEGKPRGSTNVGVANQRPPLVRQEISATFFDPFEPAIPTSLDRSLDWMSFLDFNGQDLNNVDFADFCNPPNNFCGANVHNTGQHPPP